MGWETEPLRRPAIPEDATIIFDEHGRVLHHGNNFGVDYRSHWFVLIQEGTHYALLVRHGAGDERINLGYKSHVGPVIDSFATLDSDKRYCALYCLFDLYKDTKKNATDRTASYYQMAFLEGRMKRKKRDHRYYVRVEDKIEQVTT